MKGKAAAAGILLGILSGALVWASDAWKEKPPADWTKKDVEKVLNKSPWVRPIINVVAVAPARPPASAKVEAFDYPEPQPVSPNGRVQPPAAITTGTPLAGGTSVVAHRAVRWLSSSTMRQAIARARQLVGQPADDGLREFLAAAGDCYLIGVGDLQWVSDPSPLLVAPRDPSQGETLSTTYLELRPSKKKVSPASTVLVSTRFTVPSRLYCFPKQVNGQATIGPRETKATLRWGPRNDAHQVDFNLTKMVREGKPDL